MQFTTDILAKARAGTARIATSQSQVSDTVSSSMDEWALLARTTQNVTHRNVILRSTNVYVTLMSHSAHIMINVSSLTIVLKAACPRKQMDSSALKGMSVRVETVFREDNAQTS